jgi:hypothetical protein
VSVQELQEKVSLSQSQLQYSSVRAGVSVLEELLEDVLVIDTKVLSVKGDTEK